MRNPELAPGETAIPRCEKHNEVDRFDDPCPRCIRLHEAEEAALERAVVAVVEAAMVWDASARVHQSTEAMIAASNHHAGRMANACAALAAFRKERAPR